MPGKVERIIRLAPPQRRVAAAVPPVESTPQLGRALAQFAVIGRHHSHGPVGLPPHSQAGRSGELARGASAFDQPAQTLGAAVAVGRPHAR